MGSWFIEESVSQRLAGPMPVGRSVGRSVSQYVGLYKSVNIFNSFEECISVSYYLAMYIHWPDSQFGLSVEMCSWISYGKSVYPDFFIYFSACHFQTGKQERTGLLRKQICSHLRRSKCYQMNSVRGDA